MTLGVRFAEHPRADRLRGALSLLLPQIPFGNDNQRNTGDPAFLLGRRRSGLRCFQLTCRRRGSCRRRRWCGARGWRRAGRRSGSARRRRSRGRGRHFRSRGRVALAEKLDIENKSRLGRNGRFTSFSVRKLVRHKQAPLAAGAHAFKACIPALDDLVTAVGEHVWLTPWVERRVELSAVRQVPRVVHGVVLPWLRQFPCTDFCVHVIQRKALVHPLKAGAQ